MWGWGFYTPESDGRRQAPCVSWAWAGRMRAPPLTAQHFSGSQGGRVWSHPAKASCGKVGGTGRFTSSLSGDTPPTPHRPHPKESWVSRRKARQGRERSALVAEASGSAPGRPSKARPVAPRGA